MEYEYKIQIKSYIDPSPPFYAGGTLFHVSKLINYVYLDSDYADIYVIDGQSITLMQEYKQENESWNPCLPMTFNNNKSVSITFGNNNEHNIWREWYPFNVCDYPNNIGKYNNSYLFHGGKSLSLQNLYIYDYVIDMYQNYPCMESINNMESSVIMINGLFINVSSSIQDPLFHSSFNNVKLGPDQVIFFGDFSEEAYGISIKPARSFVFERNVFQNVSAQMLLHISRSGYDVKPSKLEAVSFFTDLIVTLSVLVPTKNNVMKNANKNGINKYAICD